MWYTNEMRHCGVCRSEKRALIEDALLRKVACQKIADETGLSLSSIWRHSQHLDRQPAIVLSQSSASVPLVDRIENLVKKSEAIAAAATGAKSWQAATAALRECRACLEFLARLSGELQAGGTRVSVGVAVSVSNGHQATGGMSADQLELSIAEEVSQATDGFNPAEIQRLKALLAGHSSGTEPCKRLM
jgi:hypothetical protein